MTAPVLSIGHGPNMAHGHGICALSVPQGWVVERVAVHHRTSLAESTSRPLTLIRKGI
ncbi:hypothetical protein [Nocardia sp. NBC_01327]|uniref:hypothetical protein n=1 Tax=Nocardia sp. NBC_01327 TaxID=2903593 RepID=UPI002E15183B|nr:hypothetical protein OG326_18640 [Nocardia sp. NBC_01327]